MKRIALALTVCALCLLPVQADEDTDLYSKIAKAIDAFGSVFREVQTRYVDEVDPVELVDVGIDAMLEHLDPYTEYLVGEESEDVDMLSTGTYVGVGFVVAETDSGLYVTDLKDQGSARSAGVRIGDRIVRVDSVLANGIDSDSLRGFTRGKAGTPLQVWFVREGVSDTIKHVLIRKELTIESIFTADILPGAVGYIKLTRFTRSTANELRRAIDSLKTIQGGPLKGLILDLRDNPGGLLEAAIGVSELFLAEGSPIVTTRGRSPEESQVYTSTNAPLYPDIPLAVVINEYSASASEIVAGAMQDLDRGVIIGTRSYGKGLVQSVIPVSSGSASLKITTARYYTPSGRSIQRIDHRRGVEYKPSAEQFHTKAGRVVASLHGIDPDSTISDSVYPRMIYNLEASRTFSSFATRYAAGFTALPKNFAVTPSVLEQFYGYVKSLPLARRDRTFDAFDRLQSTLDANSWPQGTLSALQGLRTSLERDYISLLRKHEGAIKEILERQIRLRFSTASAQYRSEIFSTPSVRAAYTIITTSKIGTILAPELPSDQ